MDAEKTMKKSLIIATSQGRIWRAFRAFPGRPWRRTQDSVGHKTDDKREKKKEKKISGKREKYVKKIEEREREKNGQK